MTATAATIAECKVTGVELAIDELQTLLAKAPVATSADFRTAALKVRVALASWASVSPLSSVSGYLKYT